MALDFPSNPIDGQIYGSYTWSSSRGVWQAREESAATAITSPIAPATANPGDIWVNTSTGIAFVYYDDGNSSQWMELLSSAVPSVREIMPAGTIVQTARTSAAAGWLMSQGQAVSRTTYSDLYNAIGTTYGVGDGSTTFNVPDLRGRVPVGKADSGTFVNLNASGGAETHTLTEAQMPSHTHIQNSHNHIQDAHGHTASTTPQVWSESTGSNNWELNYGGTTKLAFQRWSNLSTSIGTATATNQATTATNQNTGGGLAHNNLQPYIVLNYMIKV